MENLLIIGVAGGLIIGMVISVLYLIKIEKLMNDFKEREDKLIENMQKYLEKEEK